jgi:hypothetical protein
MMIGGDQFGMDLGHHVGDQMVGPTIQPIQTLDKLLHNNMVKGLEFKHNDSFMQHLVVVEVFISAIE